MSVKILIFLLFIVIMGASLGCIDSKKVPAPNETEIATPHITPSLTEQKILSPNETESLKINIPFDTWSRGYYSNLSYYQPYFKVINNYSEWTSFLDYQGYLAWQAGEGPPRLEGTIFPGISTKTKVLEPADFNNYSIIAAMMGRISRAEGPEIEIKNITRINNVLNVIVMYKLGPGAALESAPYHIVMVKRELLPSGNSTFNFIDNEGKLLGKIEVKV